MTPLPRTSKPNPEMLPIIETEFLEQASVCNDQSVDSQKYESESFHDLSIREDASGNYFEQGEYVSKTLYLQQQEVILSLQNQVEALQREIWNLKERLSTNVHSKDAIASPRQYVVSVDGDNHSVSSAKSFDQATVSEVNLNVDKFNSPSHLNDSVVEHEEESFICQNPFESCEMEAPSIFNFDLFLQTLKDRQGLGYKLKIPQYV